MRIKYSTKAIFVLTALIAIVVCCQMRLNQNIAALKQTILDPTSALHTSKALPVEAKITIIDSDMKPTIWNLLLFRRDLNFNYSVQYTKDQSQPAHYRTRLRTGQWELNIPVSVVDSHSTSANVSPFGYRTK